MNTITKFSSASLALALVIGLNTTSAHAGDVVDAVVGNDNLSTLETLVVGAGLVPTLQSLTNATVFAPANSAFDKLPKGLSRAIANDSDGSIVKSILGYHVIVSPKIMSTDVPSGKGVNVETFQGSDVRARTTGSNVFINNAKVVIADVETSNAVVHVIDRVLIPWHDSEFRKDVITALKRKAN